jgi:hypothetical protein
MLTMALTLSWLLHCRCHHCSRRLSRRGERTTWMKEWMSTYWTWSGSGSSYSWHPLLRWFDHSCHRASEKGHRCRRQRRRRRRKRIVDDDEDIDDGVGGGVGGRTSGGGDLEGEE